MSFFQIASILITLSAVFSYVNFRYIRLPTTVGVMLIAIIASLALIAIGSIGSTLPDLAAGLVAGIDFNKLLLHALLAFLLFAGALHLDLTDLSKEWLPISVLAAIGTLASTFIIAGAIWFIASWFNVPLPLLDCLLFGALISPTDPIAVLTLLKQAKAPKSLETQMAGESLFNDGVGVVIFLVLLQLTRNENAISAGGVALLFFEQALGGVALGMASGWIAYRMLKAIDNYHVEVMITLALAMGCYALADAIGVSAPIAIVVAGLLIGNHGRHFAMSDTTREHLDMFWELIDEILNAFLFLLLGLQLLVIPFARSFVWAALAAIAITLLARWLYVAGLIFLMRPIRSFTRGTITLLTWGGLRGGISVAMALSLPQSPHRNLLLTLTYSVVVFSVLAQGVTMPKVIRIFHSSPRT